MSSAVARHATPADLPQIADALALSFQDDPVMAWIFGEDHDKALKHIRTFFRHEGARHLRNPYVFTTQGHDGASYWDPPGKWKTSPRDFVSMALPMLRGVHRRIPRALTGLGRMDKVHEAQPQDHYYLAVLGTRPDRQGKGVGSELMRPVLDRCDELGIGAYLESSKERNVPFYRRHGFEVVEEIEFSKGGPTLWGMWRDPREPGSGTG